MSSNWDVIVSYASLLFLIFCFIIGFQGDLSMHCCVLCKFYVFEQRDVGELMFSLSRLNKTHDYAFVPTTFGDRLFQLRRLGESDLITLMAHLWTMRRSYGWRERRRVHLPEEGPVGFICQSRL